MIENFGEGKYYLYRHIRLDKNEPFYIGIGKKILSNESTLQYKRAKASDRRNSIWNKIVSKNSYRVEILLESDDREFIIEKEKEFISLYGRIDLETGILSNMTSGGDGMSEHKPSVETLLKMSNSMIGKNTGKSKSLETKLKLSLATKGILKPNSGRSKAISQYSIEGVWIKDWKSMREASRVLKIHHTDISYCLKNLNRKSSGGYKWKYKLKDQ